MPSNKKLPTPEEVSAELEVQRLTAKAAAAGIKQLQADVYYRSIMCSRQELAAAAAWREKYDTHLHTYDLIAGVGVFYYRCRECGDGTGQILYPEGRSAV